MRSFPARWVDAGRGLLTGVVSASRGVGHGLRVVPTEVARGLVLCARGRGREGRFKLRRGLWRVAQLPADLVLMLLGRVVSATQVLSGFEPPGRGLTGFEIALVRPIFGTSLDYAAVRVKEGPLGLLGFSGRAFVHGNTVFIPPGRDATDLGLLVHELTHVWQHQHGGTAYMSAALAAQFVGDGYNWRNAVKKGLRWEELNPEQQAQLIEDAALCDLIQPGRELSTLARLRGWSEDGMQLLAEALASLRAGRGAP
ncbi:eCIS core domain-containing protein [Myxococcus stipitatus]|uniref:eCIS core domain-containing protein n=1 Tax=Myxococcus stipitatus TaxID=83455 RepID=UPI0030D4DAFA